MSILTLENKKRRNGNFQSKKEKKRRKEIPNQRVGESKKKREEVLNQRVGESKKKKKRKKNWKAHLAPRQAQRALSLSAQHTLSAKKADKEVQRRA